MLWRLATKSNITLLPDDSLEGEILETKGTYKRDLGIEAGEGGAL